MSEQQIVEWITSASPTQFLLGVAILVFGSKKVLSEKNLTESLSGLALPFRWIHRRMDAAANREAEASHILKAENVRLQREATISHRWGVLVTKRNRQLELWAAEHGLELPPPQFEPYQSFFERITKEEADE